MIAKYQTFFFCVALAVMLTAGGFPGSSFRVCPPEVAFPEFENPRMVKPLELLCHVVSHMPNCRAMAVVDLAVVPDL